MSNTDPAINLAVGRLACAVRTGNTEAERTERENLLAAKLEKHVREALASAPTLRPEQRERIARILAGEMVPDPQVWRPDACPDCGAQHSTDTARARCARRTARAARAKKAAEGVAK